MIGAATVEIGKGVLIEEANMKLRDFIADALTIVVALTSAPIIAAEPQPITLVSETGNPVGVFSSEDAIRFYGHMEAIGTSRAELFGIWSQSIACTVRSGESAILLRNYGCLADPLLPSQSVCFSEVAITSGPNRGACRGVVPNRYVLMPPIRAPMPAPQ
jgi:hypothetical protein